jgi:hypothetical protein
VDFDTFVAFAYKYKRNYVFCRLFNVTTFYIYGASNYLLLENKTALFWTIKQGLVVIPYRRFGITYRNLIHRLSRIGYNLVGFQSSA